MEGLKEKSKTTGAEFVILNSEQYQYNKDYFLGDTVLLTDTDSSLALAKPKYDSSDAYKKRYIEGAIKDPVVELLIIPTIEDVKFDGDFDYVVMAQSPNYTPASADFILDIFREYIEEI